MAIEVQGGMLFDDFGGQTAGLTKEAFLEKCIAPVLLIELREGETAGDGTYRTLPPQEPDSGDEPLVGSKVGASEVVVHPLAKSGRNEDEAITLGRADDCDIVVRCASVSKRHALFRFDPETRLVTVADAGSAHGTLLNGEPVPADQAVSLASSASLVFGGAVRAVFFSADNFYDYIQIQHRFGRV